VTANRNKFIFNKNQPDALFSKFYFWLGTLHVSGNSSAHHQEFNNCTFGIGTSHTGFEDSLLSRLCLKAVFKTGMTCTNAECTVVELLMMDRGTARNM
jgi:hypothetical protein